MLPLTTGVEEEVNTQHHDCPPLVATTHTQELDAELDTDENLIDHQTSPALWPAPALPALPALPQLLASPRVYSGSCLALSTQLVAYIQSLLAPPPCIAVSIGSGFGLLEAHLMNGTDAVHVIGVEVEPSPNKYLPPSHHRTVNGTRFLEPLTARATTWLFVYPRRVGLVKEYMAAYGEGSVERIIWAGPRADWDDYKTCFTGWHLHEQEAGAVGGHAWELIAVASKSSA